MPQVIRGGAVGPIGVEALQRTNANLAQTAQNFSQLGRDIQARRQAKQDVAQIPFEETLARFGGDEALVAMQQPDALYDYYKTMFGPVRAAREVAQKAQQRLSPQGIATAAQLGILTGEVLRSNPTLDVLLNEAKGAGNPAKLQEYLNSETQKRNEFIAANPGASATEFDTNIATAKTLINNFKDGEYIDTSNVPIMPNAKPLLRRMEKDGLASWGVPKTGNVGEGMITSPQNSAEGAIPSGGVSNPVMAGPAQPFAPGPTPYVPPQYPPYTVNQQPFPPGPGYTPYTVLQQPFQPGPGQQEQPYFGRLVMAAGRNFPVPREEAGESSIPGMEDYDEMTGGQDAHHLAAVGEGEGIINAFAMKQPGVAEMVSKLNSQFANPAAPLAPKTVPQNGHDVQYEQDVMAKGQNAGIDLGGYGGTRKGIGGWLDKRAQGAGALNWKDAMSNRQDYSQYEQAPSFNQAPMGGTGYRPTPGVVVGPGAQGIMTPQMYGAPVMAEGSSPKSTESTAEVDPMKEEEARIAHIIKLQELGNKTQDAQVKQMVLQNLNKLGWKTPFQASQNGVPNMYNVPPRMHQPAPNPPYAQFPTGVGSQYPVMQGQPIPGVTTPPIMASGRVPVFAPGMGIAPGPNDQLDPYAEEKAKAVGWQDWVNLINAGKATAADVPRLMRGKVSSELDIPLRDFREQATGSPFLFNPPIQGEDGLTLTKDDPGYVETRKAFPYSETGAPPQVHPQDPNNKNFPATVKDYQGRLDRGELSFTDVPIIVAPYLSKPKVPFKEEPAYTRLEFVKPSDPVVTKAEEKPLPEDEELVDNKTKGQNVQAAKEATQWISRNARKFGGLNQSQISANFANLFMPEGVTIEDMASTTDRTIEAKQNRDRINEARRQFDAEMVLKWDQQNLDRETQKALTEAKGNIKSWSDANPEAWAAYKTNDARQWEVYKEVLSQAKGDPVKARELLSARLQADPELTRIFNYSNYLGAIAMGDPTASQWLEQGPKKEPGALINAWWNFRKTINSQFDAEQAYQDFVKKDKNRGETVRTAIPVDSGQSDLSQAAFDAWKAKFGF